jgi:hypothetical protein
MLKLNSAIYPIRKEFPHVPTERIDRHPRTGDGANFVRRVVGIGGYRRPFLRANRGQRNVLQGLRANRRGSAVFFARCHRRSSRCPKPTAKLTLERIWQAVEKGKGRPSKLVTRQATYVMSPQQSLKPEQRLPAGRYSLLMSSIENRDTAQRVADELYKIGGVQRVSVDIAQSTFFVQSANGVSISPWALATAAERAQGEPVSIGGPYGLLTIERPVESKAAAAGVPAYPVNQGVGR